MRTENCIICLAPAVLWTGHVTKGKQKITAGFCRGHKIVDLYITFKDGLGRYGDYKNDYGIISGKTAL